MKQKLDETIETLTSQIQSVKKLKQELDETLETLSSQTEETASIKSGKNKSEPEVEAPTEEELNEFYAKLNTCKTKPVALSLIPPYSQSFVTRSRNIKTVSSLYDKNYLDIEYHQLLDACSSVEFELTDEEIKLS